MKIKDVVQEGVYDWFTQRDAARAQASSQQADRTNAQQAQAQAQAQQQAVGQIKTNPARSAPPSQQVAQNQQTQAGGWVTTPDGVQLKPATQTSPTFAKYNKQIYRLTSDDRWVDVRDKPVTQTMMALLNQALAQT